MGWKRFVVLPALLASGLVLAAPQSELEARMERVERLLDSGALVEMLSRLERLQQEVQELRGAVEEQNHAVETLQRRQRDLYLDIDRRMSRIEREGGGGIGAAAPPPGTAGAAPREEAAPDTAPATADASVQEREAYQQAFDLLREMRYPEAIAAFRTFLAEHPAGRYAHIAQYWLGEANYTQGDYAAAIDDYRNLISNHPRSPKVAEAMLKIGYSYYELGEAASAEATLRQLITERPNTTEAGQARLLIQRMRQAD